MRVFAKEYPEWLEIGHFSRGAAKNGHSRGSRFAGRERGLKPRDYILPLRLFYDHTFKICVFSGHPCGVCFHFLGCHVLGPIQAQGSHPAEN